MDVWTFGSCTCTYNHFPAGDHMAARNRQDRDANTNNRRIHKISTAFERSVRKLLEGLNIFDGTNLTPISNEDQDSYMFDNLKSNLDNYQHYKTFYHECDGQIGNSVCRIII